MQACEAESMTHVFASEGGYTNDPKDPGGPTNWGITIFDARKYGREFGWVASPSIADMRAMPKSFAEKVYDAKYWDALNCDLLPEGLDYVIFDYGVNSGIGRAGKVLRRLLGLPDNDYHVTPEVLAAVAKRRPADLINAVNAERLAFLKRLPTWPHFGPGWGRRVSSVNAIALHMSTQPAANDNRPAPHVTQDNEVMAKAVHPAPSVAKTATGGTVATTTTATTAAASGGHPIMIAVIVVAGVIATIVAVEWGAVLAARKTEEATPGIVPVPVAA
jgi:lysozyme family protein